MRKSGRTFFFKTYSSRKWSQRWRHTGYYCSGLNVTHLNSRFLISRCQTIAPKQKHLDISLFYVNKTCRNIIYATTEYSAWTNLFLRKRKKLFKSGFWSLVSVFGCFGVYFFFFLSLALILWYLVFCSVKAVNRSLHLCIWKVSLLKYFCVF